MKKEGRYEDFMSLLRWYKKWWWAQLLVIILLLTAFIILSRIPMLPFIYSNF